MAKTCPAYRKKRRPSATPSAPSISPSSTSAAPSTTTKHPSTHRPRRHPALTAHNARPPPPASPLRPLMARATQLSIPRPFLGHNPCSTSRTSPDAPRSHPPSGHHAHHHSTSQWTWFDAHNPFSLSITRKKRRKTVHLEITFQFVPGLANRCIVSCFRFLGHSPRI
jgi:hypothetical protein